MRRAMLLRAAVFLLALSPLAAGAAGAGESTAGQALFRRQCGICHLKGGTGTFMLGRRLGEQNALLETRADLAGEYVRTAVRNGIQSMPRFSRVELPDADLALIVQYLSSAQPR
jgi:mono/diheme cytochrome c family protein